MRVRLSFFIAIFLMCFACESEDNATAINQQLSRVYQLGAVAEPAISGSAKFIKNENGTITINLELVNATLGETYPAFIYLNTAAETGAVAITLESLTVVNTTAFSSTTIGALDNGTLINYEELLTFDGYLNIVKSPTELNIIYAQSDIGQNALTGESVSYNLKTADVAGVTGVVNFYKRTNTEVLAEINLKGTTAGGNHPAYIYSGNTTQAGGIEVTLVNVSGTTGISKTNLSKKDDGTTLTYNDIVNYNGSVKIHNSTTDLTTIVAQGNIGVNQNIEQAITYTVTQTGNSAYVFNGGDFTDANNPELKLKRGQTYIFDVNTTGNPFYIKEQQVTGTVSLYTKGISGNGAEVGQVIFNVPTDAPNTLYYISENQAGLTGLITISN